MKNKEGPKGKMSQADIDLENKRLDRDIVSSFHSEEVDMIPDGDVSMYSEEMQDWIKNMEDPEFMEKENSKDAKKEKGS